MQLEVGAILEGKVTGISKFGAFVALPDGKVGLVHISEVAPVYVKEITDHIKENDAVRVKVLDMKDGKISLSIKRAMDPPKSPPRRAPVAKKPFNAGFGQRSNEPQSFEDMMSKFKQTSDERMGDLKRSSDGKRGGASRRGGK